MSWTWRDAGILARVARILLWAQAALCALWVLIVLAGESLPVDKGLIAILDAVALLVFLACAVAVLAWTYRANANARANGATDMMVSPGWAVGWYFVPFAYLAMPLVAMRELWKASTNPRDWQLIPAPAVTILWWTCWLIAFIAFNVALALADEPDPDTATAAPTGYLIANIFAVPAALTLAHIIGRIQMLQIDARTKGAFS